MPWTNVTTPWTNENASEYWRKKRNMSQRGTRQCRLLWARILGTACEFRLSLISSALSQWMSRLGLNTNVFIVQMSREFSRLYTLHPWYWNTLFHGLISGENSAHFLQLEPSLQHFLFQQGRHSWVGRGSMEWKVCPTVLHMTSNGNPRDPPRDLNILSPIPYPLGHICRLPQDIISLLENTTIPGLPIRDITILMPLFFWHISITFASIINNCNSETRWYFVFAVKWRDRRWRHCVSERGCESTPCKGWLITAPALKQLLWMFMISLIYCFQNYSWNTYVIPLLHMTRHEIIKESYILMMFFYSGCCRFLVQFIALLRTWHPNSTCWLSCARGRKMGYVVVCTIL